MTRRRADSTRWYRLLLRCFPHELRRDYGDEMVRLFRQREREAKGLGGRIRLWAGAMTDAMRYGRLADLSWRLPRPPRPGRGALHRVWQDVRIGLRVHRRTPGSSLVAVATMALGVGATTAIFSFADGLIGRPLPVRESSRVVRLFHAWTGQGGGYSSFAYPDYVELRDRTTALSGLAAWQTIPLDFGAPPAEAITAQIVSGNYFSVLGVDAALGRTFAPDEDRTPGTHPVAVLSHTLWRDRFGADDSVVGATVRLNGHPFEVIGVAPQGFQGLELSAVPAVWVPLMMHDVAMPAFRIGDVTLFDNPGTHWLEFAGRLAPGVEAAAAADALRTVADWQARTYPETHEGWTVSVVPADQARVGPPSGSPAVRIAALLGVIVVLVLGIACANVANLMLARGVSRRREMGIRLAVGASRGHVVRQVLTESLLLAGAGGALGVGLAAAAMPLLPWLDLGGALPGLTVQLDMRVLSFAVAVTLVTGVASGLVPALQAPHAAPVRVLGGVGQNTGGASGRRRLREGLVVVQVALCLVLLVGAGLTLRTVQNLRGVPLGFSVEDLWIATIDRSQRGDDAASGRVAYDDLLEQVRAMPGVESASVGLITPFTHMNMAGDIEWAPSGSGGDRQRGNVGMNVVGAGYFATMRIPLLGGRQFSARDRTGAPDVAVVNRALAEQLWPGQDPIGRVIWRPRRGGTARRLEVVGVVADGRYHRSWRSSDVRPFLFLPAGQWEQRTLALHVRGATLTATALRAAIAAASPGLPSVSPQRVADAMAQSMAFEHVVARLLGAFGLLAAAIATIGIYGVVAFVVGERTYEIGLRMALGASRPGVLRLVLGRSVGPVLLGIAAGWMTGLLLGRFLASVLFGVRATDPATYLGVSALLLLVGLIASYLPARRATRIDPLATLRG